MAGFLRRGKEVINTGWTIGEKIKIGGQMRVVTMIDEEGRILNTISLIEWNAIPMELQEVYTSKDPRRI